ncbi:hypothetical protein WH47_05540 [Habropoda laboriosa]|uniref:Uncharacterized protein n=1 Tax=Habropoda laboriosa TaxID=597456 RepID=A0A0L7RF34_9HYME|nr:hypothetical protein WH47_05540 [Habropoda laboriosa]
MNLEEEKSRLPIVGTIIILKRSMKLSLILNEGHEKARNMRSIELANLTTYNAREDEKLTLYGGPMHKGLSSDKTAKDHCNLKKVHDPSDERKDVAHGVKQTGISSGKRELNGTKRNGKKREKLLLDTENFQRRDFRNEMITKQREKIDKSTECEETGKDDTVQSKKKFNTDTWQIDKSEECEETDSTLTSKSVKALYVRIKQPPKKRQVARFLVSAREATKGTDPICQSCDSVVGQIKGQPGGNTRGHRRTFEDLPPIEAIALTPAPRGLAKGRLRIFQSYADWKFEKGQSAYLKKPEGDAAKTDRARRHLE